MRQRILTALLGIPIVVGMLIVGKWGFIGVWGAAGALLILEWLQAESVPLPQALFLAGLMLLPGLWVFEKELWYFWLLGIAIFLTVRLHTMEPRVDFAPLLRQVVGILYIGLGWGSLLWVFFPAYDPKTVLIYIAAVWVADSTAYFSGRALGKRPILPKVSPKKTWEGFVAGVLAAGVWGELMGIKLFRTEYLSGFLGGVLTALAAFWGDAWQSAWKRSLGIKDSGSLLPGHGGFWDRLDSLLWAAPLWYLLS